MTKRIERISTATREQAKTSQLISEKSLVMKDLTDSVDRAMGEQATGSDGIARGHGAGAQLRGEHPEGHPPDVPGGPADRASPWTTISGASQQNLGGARDLAATSSALRQEALLLVEQLG